MSDLIVPKPKSRDGFALGLSSALDRSSLIIHVTCMDPWRDFEGSSASPRMMDTLGYWRQLQRGSYMYLTDNAKSDLLHRYDQVRE